jgi:hypothetical protein
VASIEFINNQPCVDLIEKAILPKLDDMNVSTWDKTDEQFLDQLSRTQKDSKYFGSCSDVLCFMLLSWHCRASTPYQRPIFRVSLRG